MKKRILKNYFEKQVFAFLFGVLLILFLILLSNQFFLVLRESISINFSNTEIFNLLFLKVLKNLNILLSISFLVAISVVVSKAYKSTEIVAINNSGIGDKGLLSIFSRPLLIVFFVVLTLTMFITPLLDQNIELLKENAKSRPSYLVLKSNTFHTFQNNKVTFYASRVNDSENNFEQFLSDIFIYAINSDGSSSYLISDSGKKFSDSNNKIFIELYKGSLFEVKNKNINISEFDKNRILIFDSPKKTLSDLKLDIITKDIFELIKIKSFKSLGELQYRISQPLSFLLMSLVSILLVKTSPRNTKNFSYLLIILLYSFYYSLVLVSKSLTESGQINYIIGFFITHIIFIASFLIIYKFKIKF